MTEQVPSEAMNMQKLLAAPEHIYDSPDPDDARKLTAIYLAAEVDARLAELESAVHNFIKGMDEAEQIRELVTKISRNPVSGVSAYIWWCSRYLNVSCFNEAREVLEKKP